MASMNEMTVVGHLGADAEVRFTKSGIAVANVSVATNEKIGDKDMVEWHRFVLWRELAEAAGKLWKKGKQVYVKGRKRTRTYDDNGVEKTIVEFHAITGFLTGPAPKASAPPVDIYENMAPKSPGEMRPARSEEMAEEIPF